MRVIVQRVLEASVQVAGETVGKIDKGFMLLVGFTDKDNNDTIKKMVDKILKLRVFDDENGVMNKSILDIPDTKILSVSQFTLYADTTKGNRPSYIKALRGEEAIKLYDYFNQVLSNYITVQTGIFGADMKVHLVNDGPITITLERE
ncbi:MAG: D-tyrosyl-tRNA(Tyr) deacylase [Bacilli bacterium]|nr:D-tyrosyl-tRNA(Tyr) deacylase [Bacilli bacterium]